MTELGRIPKDQLDQLEQLGPVDAALVLRQALGYPPGYAPARCTGCNRTTTAPRRAGTTFAGSCSCGGTIEIRDYS